MTKIKSFFQKLRSRRELRIITLVLFLIPYLLYIGFMVIYDQGPIDYETFMRIGTNFRTGQQVYGENSYYPLPYVAIFSIFSLLPRPISMAIWFGFPIIVALFVVGFRPYVLLFAPVFSHFVGGQSSIFGLLGFWGYRNDLDPASRRGGAFLALTMLKPQLGVVPLAYAVYRWAQFILKNRKIPKQLTYFALTLAVLYAPAFILQPRWVGEWLSVPRPLFSRALSGAIPRLLTMVLTPNSLEYWFTWVLLSLVTLAVVWYFRDAGHPLDMLLLWSFLANPLVHDYDLIQVIPTIEGVAMQVLSILFSIPGWWTILTNYSNDAAWITFTIIAPGLLGFKIIQSKRRSSREQAG